MPKLPSTSSFPRRFTLAKHDFLLRLTTSDLDMSLNTTLDAMVLLGDSITEGSWVAEGLSTRLAQFYVRKLDIINRGYGGACSSAFSIS